MVAGSNPAAPRFSLVSTVESCITASRPVKKKLDLCTSAAFLRPLRLRKASAIIAAHHEAEKAGSGDQRHAGDPAVRTPGHGVGTALRVSGVDGRTEPAVR